MLSKTIYCSSYYTTCTCIYIDSLGAEWLRVRAVVVVRGPTWRRSDSLPHVSASLSLGPPEAEDANNQAAWAVELLVAVWAVVLL